ncbi:MAG: hypothetical protein DI626_08975 [Micavibrio aeruginosavorus]|uniref:Uncharacterized protein n=1 Tax=Micavibrio aeruginosavorus TaxID=349221 RepID=A0A2W4ZMK6_9BACT|nr:MAG: hypothetical protein DI626_08975 [Micavibrio aeruginosavorus]
MILKEKYEHKYKRYPQSYPQKEIHDDFVSARVRWRYYTIIPMKTIAINSQQHRAEGYYDIFDAAILEPMIVLKRKHV